MAERVTIQDIADALGVSRNTVSKAINNTGILADSTREKVLQKAIEMGYKHFSYINMQSNQVQSQEVETPQGKGEIALFTTQLLGNSHFASTMIDKLQSELSQVGYSLSMHRIRSTEVENLVLPLSFNKDKTSGILCVELFNYNYAKMVCDIGIPTLFADTPVLLGHPLNADRLFMDNTSAIFEFVENMISRGKKRIGFIGDHMHCQSFFERFMAFRNAMYMFGAPISEDYCIIGTCKGLSYEEYRSYLEDTFLKLDSLPDAFICANDFVAIDTLQVFKKLNVSVPNDVYLCGFDDSSESKIITPSLTTIHIHSQIMGFTAAHLLLSRIQEPTLNYRTYYAETNIVYRESTEN
jgi:LacI family transcriptional regulator